MSLLHVHHSLPRSPVIAAQMQIHNTVAAGCACALLCAVVSACNGPAPGREPVVPKEYFPLAVGNVWHSVAYTVDSTMTKIAGSETSITDSVVGELSIGGRTAFAMVTISGAVSDTLFYARTDAGDVIRFVDTTRHDHVGVWQPATSLSNTSIDSISTAEFSHVMLNGTGDLADTLRAIDKRAEVVKGDTIVTVPAGTFTAQRRDVTIEERYGATHNLNPTAMTWRHTVYRADHVGVIKEITRLESEGGINRSAAYVRELVSYAVR